MSEELTICGATKEEKYQSLLPQVKSLLDGENDWVAGLANVSAALASTFKWWWTGFYIVKGGQLVLGPFQGPIACTRIALGKGVCGAAWKDNKTIVVPNVDEFPGHIACSSLSKSEIVVPLRNNLGEVIGVLDVDSEHLDCFDETDAKYLGAVAGLAARLFG
jgi:GAF domain-containing protein